MAFCGAAKKVLAVAAFFGVGGVGVIDCADGGVGFGAVYLHNFLGFCGHNNVLIAGAFGSSPVTGEKGF